MSNNNNNNSASSSSNSSTNGGNQDGESESETWGMSGGVATVTAEEAAAAQIVGGNCDPAQVRLLAERIILVDESDTVLGPVSKAESHLWTNINGEKNMLHRAFSVFMFNPAGELLIQKRSNSKITWPLYWANTCCSHPWHSEDEMAIEDAMGVKRAAVRKLGHELGIHADALPLSAFTFLTRVHYKAQCPDPKWGEHEVDHILAFRAPADIAVKPNPEEVAEVRWVSRERLAEMVSGTTGDNMSPWFGLITKTLLDKWWDAVLASKDLNELEERSKIYRLGFEQGESAEKTE